MHEMARQQDRWDADQQFLAVNVALAGTRPRFNPVREIVGAALIGGAIATFVFVLIALGGLA